MNEEILNEQIFKLSTQTYKLQNKLKIALQGLEALFSGGEQTGIAQKTLEAIKELDLPQDSLEVEK